MPKPHTSKRGNMVGQPSVGRVFISSTSIDLEEYRQAVFKAIQSLGGYAEDMVFWSADERSGAALSLDRVRQSDAVILLVAHRYGHIPEGAEYSVTETEYRTARAAGIPIFAFVLDEDVPWPPKFVEREKGTELERFKALISKEVTRRYFHTPDELLALVTQALVSFGARSRSDRHRSSGSFLRAAAVVSQPALLRSTPDAVVQVGTAEDGVPSVLEVKRSRDVSSLLQEIANNIAGPGSEVPEAMFKTFEQSLVDQSRRAWARERVFRVSPRAGATQEMYVTPATLATLFNPLFAAILDTADSQHLNTGEQTLVGATTYRKATVPAYATGQGILESVGGHNRFLGISLHDGSVWSVGQREDDEWIGWRPFLFESLPATFPDSRFELCRVGSGDAIAEGPVESYIEALENEALDVASETGSIDLFARFVVSRASVGQTVLRIAMLVDHYHKAGRIHGDLKPTNVLLTANEPTLIDEFAVKAGDVAPGWTPEWSAPEQVLGNSITPAADIYSLGIMLVRLLGGCLVGEVRKFRTVRQRNGRNEFDIYYNPFVHLDTNQSVIGQEGLREWLGFTRSCLTFDPGNRTESAAEFVAALRSLLNHYPPEGDVRVTVPGKLMIARLIDGSQSTVRLLDAEPRAGAGHILRTPTQLL